jgi:hypothetical protein
MSTCLSDGIRINALSKIHFVVAEGVYASTLCVKVRKMIDNFFVEKFSTTFELIMEIPTSSRYPLSASRTFGCDV